jgi:hypothetical protein
VWWRAPPPPERALRATRLRLARLHRLWTSPPRCRLLRPLLRPLALPQLLRTALVHPTRRTMRVMMRRRRLRCEATGVAR